MDSQIHKFEATLHENYFVPAHPPRTQSKGYRQIHKQLIVTEDSPCSICGLRQSQLKDKAINILGATDMELHHKVVEWSWHTVASQTKISKDYPQVIGMSRQEFLDWLDHGRECMYVLCNMHHRNRDIGIHEVSNPSFNLVKYIQDDFTLVDSTQE